MQIINVNMISMNYENVCEYLCFCCADAVDCGAASPRYMIFTLTLVLSLDGRGDSVGCVGLFHPRHAPPLWIDESPITLCQRVRF